LTEYRSSRGRNCSLDVWEYNEHGKIVSSKKYIKKDKKLKYQWFYEYYSNKMISKIIVKNRKGKSINTWNYDCKPEGISEKSKEKTTYVCAISEQGDSILTKTYITTNEKNKIVKAVYVYRSLDTAIISSKNYNGKDELLSEQKYLFSYDKLLISINYRKTKVVSQVINKYENGLLMEYSYQFKNKPKSISTLKYEDGLLVKISKMRGNKLFRTTDYSYVL
jgi:hypothetical protein